MGGALSRRHTSIWRDARYVDGARRFDMGERDHFVSLEMAAIGMEMMAGGATTRRRSGSLLTGTSRMASAISGVA